MTSRLDEAVLASPADEAELVWLEVQRSLVGHGPRRPESEVSVERTVMARVREGGREGRYRTVGSDLPHERLHLRRRNGGIM